MMGGGPARRALAGLLAAGALCSAFGVAAFGVAATGAGAAATHRAGLIVDTGSDTHIVVVSFPEDSITGLDLLRRAGADPVVRSFTGQGGGVCALYGVGHTADSSCLGSNDDPRYWGYFLAHGGATSWTYARAGAGSVTVHDGDVDGWRYGSGDSPSFRSFAQLTGTVSPTTAASVTTTVASAAAATTAVPGSTAPPTVLVQGTHVTVATTSAPLTPGTSTRVTTTTRPRRATASKSSNRSTSSTTSATTSSPPIADGTSTTIPTTTSSRKSATEPVAAAAVRTGRHGSGSRGSAAALIGFVVVLGGLGTAIVMTRRARNRAKPLT